MTTTLARRLLPAVSLFAMTVSNAVAQTASDTLEELTTPVSHVQVGAIGAIGDADRIDIYDVRHGGDLAPRLSGRYVSRDDRTGTWIRVEGNNLGLGSRDVALEYERQGGWKAWLNYSQITRSDPLDISTGLTGIGGGRQFVAGAPLRLVDLETERYRGELGFTKQLNDQIGLRATYRVEYKEGDRNFGVYDDGSELFFLTEPIDYWHQEMDAALNYVTKRLQLSGGIRMSLFDNNHTTLVNDTPNPTLSLPPDNRAYKAFIEGAYRFTPKTQRTFKFSYNRMEQSGESLTAPTFGGNTETALDGEVHNYFGQLSLSSRPIRDLTLRGKLRHDRRDDNTSVDQYIDPQANSNGSNVPFSRDTLTVDGEAGYKLAHKLRLIGTVRYEDRHRESPPIRQLSWRENTEEITGGLRLKKGFTPGLNAELGYSYSQRDGGNFLARGRGGNQVAPKSWSDRERHKVQFLADWTPSDDFSLQARVDGMFDSHGGLPLGARDGRILNAALDASYRLSRDWSATGWVSSNEIARNQAQTDGLQIWDADLATVGYAVGFGVRGSPREDLLLGANIRYSQDMNEYELDTRTRPAVADLPNVTYQRFDLGLWANYKVGDGGSVRAGYGFTYEKLDDFA